MSLALLVALMLYACSIISPNLAMYLCMGSSDCFNWVSLCLAIVTVLYLENFSLRGILMGDQPKPLDTSSLMNLCKFPLEIASATSTGSLSQIVASHQTLFSHLPNSCGSLPSQDWALLRQCSLWADLNCLSVSCKMAHWLVMDLLSTSMTSTMLPVGGDICWL